MGEERVELGERDCGGWRFGFRGGGCCGGGLARKDLDEPFAEPERGVGGGVGFEQGVEELVAKGGQEEMAG
jgi:hypothetical protein